MPRVRLDDDFVQSDSEFALMMVIYVGQSLLIVNTIKCHT